MLVYAKKAAAAGERIIITKYYFNGIEDWLGRVISEYRKDFRYSEIMPPPKWR